MVRHMRYGFEKCWPVYQIPLYQVYKEDKDQISGATYISDVVLASVCGLCLGRHLFTSYSWPKIFRGFLKRTIRWYFGSCKKFALFTLSSLLRVFHRLFYRGFAAHTCLHRILQRICWWYSGSCLIFGEGSLIKTFCSGFAGQPIFYTGFSSDRICRWYFFAQFSCKGFAADPFFAEDLDPASAEAGLALTLPAPPTVSTPLFS